MSDYFTGQMLSRVVCRKCDNESIAFDNIWDVALNFSSDDRGEIPKMFQNFLKEELISDDYYCSKCKGTIVLIEVLSIARESLISFVSQKFSYAR